MTTYFPTLKNDNVASATINLPGSLTVATGSNIQGSGDVISGVKGAVLRGRIASTKNFSNYFIGQSIVFNRVGTVLGSPAPYSVVVFMWRPQGTITRFQLYISNPYGGTLTTEAGDETIYMYANTFIPPYA